MASPQIYHPFELPFVAEPHHQGPVLAGAETLHQQMLAGFPHGAAKVFRRAPSRGSEVSGCDDGSVSAIRQPLSVMETYTRRFHKRNEQTGLVRGNQIDLAAKGGH